MERNTIRIGYCLLIAMLLVSCAPDAAPAPEVHSHLLAIQGENLENSTLIPAMPFLQTAKNFIRTDAIQHTPRFVNANRDFHLVATEDALLLVADLLTRREQQGFNVQTLAVESVDLRYPDRSRPEGIRAALQEALNPDAETYVMLLGSHDIIPFVYFETDAAAGAEFDVYTDGFYADLHSDFDSDKDGIYGEWGQDEFDLQIDAHVGRVPLDQPEAVLNYVARVLAFENSAAKERLNQSLLAGGYISMDGDTAIILSMVREWVLKPAGFSVFTMLEDHDYPSPPPFLQYDRELNQEEFTQELTDHDYGFVFWMSHGLWDGAYTLHSGPFIENDDLEHLNDAPPTLYFSSACLQGWPEYDNNLAKALMEKNAVSFVGSTGETYPHDLGGGSLIFLVAMDRVVVKSWPLAKGIDQARQAYIDFFWTMPYPKGMYLKNYFGFSVFGDPTLQYPDRT